MRRLLAALFGLIVIGLGLGGAALYALSRFSGPGPLPATTVVVVPRGAPSDVADALLAAGVIANRTEFRLAVSATEAKGPLKSGEFTFPEHASLFATLTILRNGRPVQHKVTFPEGLTAYQISNILQKAPALDGEVPKLADGTMFPDTYIYVYGTPRSAIVERGQAEMEKIVAKVWAARDPQLALSSPAQMVTLASLVERETSRPEERAHVAAVFLNRLKAGMKLQSDPTVVYAATAGQSNSERGITRAQLDTPSPYNTYLNAGLPPGPIASPGLASIAAVARPMATDDLYFVADGEGGHVFARTLEEHNRNVAKYRAAEAAKARP